MNKERLDARVARHVESSKTKAQALIRQGAVRVNGTVQLKNGFWVTEFDIIDVQSADGDYVSRSARKLLGGLADFGLSLQNLDCLDVGASTGGFSEVCLRQGARHVYAFDVGHGQCDPRLKAYENFTYLEGINAKDLDVSTFGKTFDFVCCDVSFISLTKIIERMALVTKPHGKMVVLFKPQFECGPHSVDRHGVVTDQNLIDTALQAFIALILNDHLRFMGARPAQIRGKEGNQEIVLYLEKE